MAPMIGAATTAPIIAATKTNHGDFLPFCGSLMLPPSIAERTEASRIPRLAIFIDTVIERAAVKFSALL